MITRQTQHTFDCVIVGGGIHGTYLSQQLLEKTALDHDDITIIDPNDCLLASFRRKAHACGMETLRSSFVQHLGLEPFSLREFAKVNEREDELVATVDYPARPSLSLFLDHAEAVLKSRVIDSLHQQATVERIERKGNGYKIETTIGPVLANNVVIAIGRGGRYRYPEWAAVEGITHVWDGFDPTVTGNTIVIGGGITAVTLACTLAERGSVTLLTRHALKWAIAEAEPPWINWSHIESNLHTEPPGSRARFEIVQAARNSTSIPPYLYHSLDRHLESGALVLEEGDIDHARYEADERTVSLHLVRNKRLTADRIVLATGFEPIFDHPFVKRVADELGLQRGYRDLPVLDDETLAWRTERDEETRLFATGALASGVVGPLAPNLPGARRASERIAKAIGTRTHENAF